MDGQPDLQGVWANNNGTPVERPKQYAGETRLTDGEVADLKARVAKVLDGGDAVFFDDLVNAALSDNNSSTRSRSTIPRHGPSPGPR